MTVLNENYRVSQGQYGLRVIEITGRCTAAERTNIEKNCTRRFGLVALPNAAGAIFKSLDGTTPKVVEIRPSTFSGKYITCVKTEGYVNPFAPIQEGGTYTGKAILYFYKRYQEVGDVA